jgi:serine/threonine-protein kinase HipA
MENNIVSVMLWGEEVGKLYWNDQLHRAVFNYNPDFIKKGLDIATLTASITKAFGKNITLLGNKSKIYQGLPEFIADSLPDKWGNTVFAYLI